MDENDGPPLEKNARDELVEFSNRFQEILEREARRLAKLEGVSLATSDHLGIVVGQSFFGEEGRTYVQQVLTTARRKERVVRIVAIIMFVVLFLTGIALLGFFLFGSLDVGEQIATGGIAAFLFAFLFFPAKAIINAEYAERTFALIERQLQAGSDPEKMLPYFQLFVTHLVGKHLSQRQKLQ